MVGGAEEGARMDRDDRWIVRNFPRLMARHGGLYVAVVRQRVVASGPSAKAVEEEACRATGEPLPSVIRIPDHADSFSQL